MRGVNIGSSLNRMRSLDYPKNRRAHGEITMSLKLRALVGLIKVNHIITIRYVTKGGG